MVHFIDKDALVAEIERRKEFYETIEKLHPVYESNIKDCDDVLSFINTLEVKEVDLKEEVERFAKECGYKSAATIDFQFAKHFFELGLKAQKGK